MAAGPNKIDLSLAILRQELECMQKQDKELYIQLIKLQENIRGLKIELKKERDECEEAFRDLQEISLDNDSSIGTEINRPRSIQSEQCLKNKQSECKASGNASAKHERQDSGISIRHYSPETEPSTNINGMSAKSTLIQHSKQDSGILIDEETMNETKLLSRLVQSSPRMFARVVNRKTKYSPNNSRCDQVEQNNRSKSSSDLLREKSYQFFRESSSSLIPNHVRAQSCPSTSIKKLNQENHYTVQACHQLRPKKRSASVVDLTKITESDKSVEKQESDNKTMTRMGSEPKLFQEKKEEPLQAVFVCAGEVNVSSTYQQRSNCRFVGQQTGPQRRLTSPGPKTSPQYYDSRYTGQNNAMISKIPSSITSSQSFQLPRTRHRTMTENLTRRRQSMQIHHASSKSWDGNITRSPSHVTNLYRTGSQISLV